MLQKMISNSVWMVTQRVNSRVTKFVRNITTQDKAVFELMYPQKHAILEEGLLDPAHKAIVVNMPTSSGKTLIAQFRILQALNQFSEDNGWVVYIAPTRALVNQVAAKLKREFEPIGIKVEKMSGAIEIDSFESNMLTDSEDRFDVLVVTPEKMNLLIRDGIETKMGRPLALAVVDEAHNIEEESRGINLEILLANIKNDCSKANFLLLTPFIKNSEERNDVNFVMEQVKQSQGFLADNLTDKINPNIISMMEGVGLLDGITVNSDFGKAVFYTTPQLIGPGIGSWKISTDVFNHAKLLLSSLRYGEYKSVSSRGAIYTSSKMMNIVNKLLRGEWVGPCTAIGEDYKLLELDGVISVQPYNGMYKMKLRQFEVGRLVKQMLEYNMVVNDSVNEIDVFNNLPTGYIAPEERRKVIQADRTVPVKNIQEKFIASIRTGGIF